MSAICTGRSRRGSQIGESFAAHCRCCIAGDGKLLFQVFSNLLVQRDQILAGRRPDRDQHAVREAGGRSRSSVRGSAASAFPRRIIDRLFSRYFRGSNVSGIVGTGVGLYLVKTVIDLHGGDVSVESREGKGAKSTVRLPATEPQPAEEKEPAPTESAPVAAGEGGVEIC
jgi:two-component system, OmpR family, sensor kinase